MNTKPVEILYLDNNATTQVAPQVVAEMMPWWTEQYGYPSSVYRLGRLAADAMEKARSRVASLLKCQSEEITFTSCGTESIHSAILSACAADPDKRHIITSSVEHSATLKLCEHLARRGFEVTSLPVNSFGCLDLERLKDAIRPDTAIVSLLWANNETGVLFPVDEIARICCEKNVLFHCDAVQAIGKLEVHPSQLGIHYLSLSGHKLHCTKGVGALYIGKRVRFNPLLHGSQENSRRAGTQNVASIVGLGKAAVLAEQYLAQEGTQIHNFRDTFEQAIIRGLPGTEVNGDLIQRLPNTSNICFPSTESEAVLLLLDNAGLCCSAGSACSSGSIHPSHVLKAMGMSNERARSSLRFSFGRFNTEAQVQCAIQIVVETIRKLKQHSPHNGPVLGSVDKVGVGSARRDCSVISGAKNS
jgi:cysteine desulfurase